MKCMPGLAVLLVDDHPTNRLLLSQQVQALGHRTSLASDGAEGLQRWLEDDFAVVILDCNMPRMNGYQLARAIRDAELRLARRPCLLLGYTAGRGADERDRCRQAGMDDCLFKPIGLEQLAQHLGTPPRAIGDRIGQGFDPAALASIAGGDPRRLECLVEEILRSCRHDRARLHTLDLRLGRALLDLTHRILGAARVVGADGVIAACERLQASAANSGASSLAILRDELVMALDALEQSLLMPRQR
jgi:two-component system sensor histidine kinase EvgS